VNTAIQHDKVNGKKLVWSQPSSYQPAVDSVWNTISRTASA